MQYVFDTRKPKRYRFPTHVNDLVMDRSQAAVSEVFITVLAPGEAPPMHIHPDTEQIFYVLEGRGVFSVGKRVTRHRIKAGDIIRVPAKTPHSVKAVGGPVRYLTVDCFIDQHAKMEATWDEHVRVVCRNFGWNYADVARPRRRR